MLNCPVDGTGKTDNFFNNKLLELIIRKHMHGIPWVKNTPLNIENNLHDVAYFIGY